MANDEINKEIRKALEANKLLIGTNSTLKALRNGELKKIYLASNAPDDLKKELNYYCDLAKVDLINLDQSNDELGLLCKKQFFISVVGLLK